MALSNKRRLQNGRVLRINIGLTPKGREVIQLVLKSPDNDASPPAVVVNERRWRQMADEIESAAAAIRRHFSPRLTNPAGYPCLEAIADLPEDMELSTLRKMDVEDAGAEEVAILTA